jgi:UDP-N-acetylmuramoyl-tripeptide--D-alanyl-D-alanine ligase
LDSEGERTATCVAEAFRLQAAGAVVAGQRVAPWAGKYVLQVEDAHWALWQLATWCRKHYRGCVIAVSGGVGKTTTRHMINAALAGAMSGTAPERGATDRVGVPLGILELAETSAYALLEYASDQPGENLAISHLCRPGIAVINSLSVRRPAAGVIELLAGLPETGCAVLNGDHPTLRELVDRTAAEVILVGRGSHCDLVASHVDCRCGELAFTVAGTRFRLPVWGRHHLHAALAAVAVGQKLGLPWEALAESLATYREPAGRCQVRREQNITVIDDTYDARVEALWAALELLSEMREPGRRIVVCGEVAGDGDETQCQRQIGHALVSRGGADYLVSCGRYSECLVQAVREAGMPARQTIRCRHPEDVAGTVQALVAAGDVVLVKGRPNGTLEQVVDSLAAAQAMSA